MLAPPLNNVGPSRLWVPLRGTVSHLNSALSHGICPARFTSALKLLFSPGPGLGEPLSSYIEVALYKYPRQLSFDTGNLSACRPLLHSLSLIRNSNYRLP